MPSTPPPPSEAVVQYKTLLRRLLDRRPSGTRQKLAETLGTHKSFISQITNPAYRVPLPAQHIPELFRVCHFSHDEQQAFLDIYRRAHASQAASLEELATLERDVLRIPLPADLDPDRRLEVERLIHDFAERIFELMRKP